MARTPKKRPARGFPGEQAWHWHTRIRIDRVMSPLRAAAYVLSGVVWFVTPHPAGTRPDLVAWTFAFAMAYVVADLMVVFRFPRAARMAPWAPTIGGFALVVAWVAVTGGPHSPYTGLAFLGVVTSTVRLRWRDGAFTTIAYVVAVLVVAGWSHAVEALYLGTCGAALVAWTAATQRERRSNLRDDLTGCFTREYAAFRMADVYARADFPVAVAVLDLDGFKRVNDTHGHSAGDAVLVQAVRAISRAIRHGDLLARTGGDEFILVLPKTDAQTACTIGDRIRTGIANTRFQVRRELPPLRLTCSAGIAVTDDGAIGAARLIDLADERLYAAKDSGRNRVAI